MKRIGLLSDTHGYLHHRAQDIFLGCDEIWHAGDIGSLNVVSDLEAICPVRAVYGNIDGQDIRQVFPKYQQFTLEGVRVLMTHIGGYPGHYAPGIAALIKETAPTLFISGHSHILKVMPDKLHGLLHMNPGAAGKSGFHKVITFLRFTLEAGRIKDLEVVEYDRYDKPKTISG